MRIVGGALSGRRLAAFKHGGVRPTTDRVREAIFNILRPYEPFNDILDLFAGTGAMGIEALSRGAANAVFVEADRSAAALVEKNLSALALAASARVVNSDSGAYLRRIAGSSAAFDLILMDPPYGAGLHKPMIEAIDKGALLNTGGVLVVEGSVRSELSPELKNLRLADRRVYGDTAVYFYKRSRE